MKGTLVLMVLMLAGLRFAGAASEPSTATEPLEIIASARPAQPLLVVPPKFPKGVSLTNAVLVEVAGTIQQDGRLDVKAITSTPNDPRFIAAVEDVLKVWRFSPAIDDSECAAEPGDYKTMITFQGSSDDPHIFVSSPKQPSAEQLPMSRIDWINYSSPQYPPSNLGFEGEVRVLLNVSPAGKVESARILTSFPRGKFDGAVLAAARGWKGAWHDPAPAQSVCVEQTLKFCLPDRGYPSVVGCKGP